MPTVRCPGCGRAIAVAAEEFGLMFQCARCNTRFRCAAPSEEPAEPPPNRWALPLVAGLVTLTFAAVLLAVVFFVVAGSQRPPTGPVAARNKTADSPAAPSRPRRTEEPDDPPPLPVFPSRKLLETAATLDSLHDKRVIVVGTVKSLGVTKLYQRTFWDVPEDLGFASLSDDPMADQSQTICVFRRGVPEGLEVGATCRIEGTFRGVIPTSGVPMLINSELAADSQ
jgi:hypothetical protein